MRANAKIAMTKALLRMFSVGEYCSSFNGIGYNNLFNKKRRITANGMSFKYLIR